MCSDSWDQKLRSPARLFCVGGKLFFMNDHRNFFWNYFCVMKISAHVSFRLLVASSIQCSFKFSSCWVPSSLFFHSDATRGGGGGGDRPGPRDFGGPRILELCVVRNSLFWNLCSKKGGSLTLWWLMLQKSFLTSHNFKIRRGPKIAGPDYYSPASLAIVLGLGPGF